MSSWTFNCLLRVILSDLTFNPQTSKALKFLLVFGTSGEGHREGDLRLILQRLKVWRPNS